MEKMALESRIISASGYWFSMSCVTEVTSSLNECCVFIIFYFFNLGRNNVMNGANVFIAQETKSLVLVYI